MANIFNALDFGLDPSNSGTGNVAALQAAVSAAEGNRGGTIVIPSFESAPGGVTYYPVTGTIQIAISDTSAISIVGSSGSAVLEKSDDTDLFTITNSNSGDGVLFQDLHIQYVGSFSGVAAFRFTECLNGRLFRVILQDCPLGVVFTDSQQCAVVECRSVYLTQNNATCITINTGGHGGTQQTQIDSCLFTATTATGCTGLSVVQSVYLSVANTQFSGFANGLALEPGSDQSVRYSVLSNVSFETTGIAATIQPSNVTGSAIQEVYFDTCQFKPYGTPAASTEGVYINTNTGGANDQVDSIFFDACSAIGWSGPGVQINAGQNIQITSGRYSSNAQNAGATTPGGIALTGAATNVRIVGADCTGAFYGTTAQSYGVAVTNNATNVYVSNCDLTGNLTGPLYTSSPGRLAVINCPGYNDQAKIVSTLAPIGEFNGATFGYYGPVAFYVSGGADALVAIDGTTTGLTQGGFTLNAPALGASSGSPAPGEFAQITSVTVPSFLMVGK